VASPARYPGEAARQALHQLIQIPAAQPGLFYSGGSSRLKISSRHNLMITRRLFSVHPDPPKLGQVIPALPHHEVRLPYQ
jgi:hypothetical protein